MTRAFRIVFCFSLVVFYSNITVGQISNVSIDPVFESYRDSLKNTPYQWRFPILGSKLRKMGFDLPFPNGIGINYAFSRQDILVEKLSVGFDENSLVNVDGFARFRSIQADVNGVTARYDFWLLPFLNFYAVGGVINSTTNVSLALPFELNFSVNNRGPVVGWGTVIAGGVGPLVLSANFTMAWTFLGKVSTPARSTVFNFQGGYMFRFKKKPERNIVMLFGIQYLGVNPSSSGSVDLEGLVGITPEKKASASEQLDDWYDDLSSTEQGVIGPIYNGISSWLNNEDPIELHYAFEKSLYYPLSLMVGFNFQINHRYNVTGLYTFLGSRDQIVVGLGYRFGFKGNNLLEGVTL